MVNTRNFHLRLTATYSGNENKIDDLALQVLHDHQWEPLQLDIRSPGFLLFINGLFSCQHLYMRTNSAECGLVLSSAKGGMNIVAGEFWDIQHAEVSFDAYVLSGEPSEEHRSYIIERMHHCPVSTNLPEHLKLKVSVSFHG